MTHPNKTIMNKAIDLAKEKYNEGGHAVAAIIVRNDEIISEAFTTINKDHDPTCHAEMNAIRKAAKKLHSKVLDNCYLYTTYEPCPMCTSAAIWSKMKGIIYGASMKDQTKSHPQRINIPASNIIKNGIPKLELYSEFMREECKKLLALKA
jgi:Cytosine/adenosine deaminases